MGWIVRAWIGVDEEDPEIHEDKADAKAELKHCRFMQPENRYELEKVEEEPLEKLEIRKPDQPPFWSLGAWNVPWAGKNLWKRIGRWQGRRKEGEDGEGV